MKGFDDGSADEVKLVHIEGGETRVPTPNEESRRAVLAFLETRLPRITRS